MQGATAAAPATGPTKPTRARPSLGRQQYFDQRRKRYYFYDPAKRAYFWEDGTPKT